MSPPPNSRVLVMVSSLLLMRFPGLSLAFLVNDIVVYDTPSRYSVTRLAAKKDITTTQLVDEMLSPQDNNNHSTRRYFLLQQIPATAAATATAMMMMSFLPQHVLALAAPQDSSPLTTTKQCTDIDSCREIGEEKIQQDLQDNPVTLLDSGVRYKVLRPGVDASEVVQDGSSIEMIYSLSREGGRYMYSQGFGYERSNLGGEGLFADVTNNNNPFQKDLGVDSLRVTVGKHQIPVGIEQALIGMKKGERRRVVLTPNVGFETSNWEPAPKTSNGKQAILAYQRILEGFGSQPPFPAPTVWDIEVLRIKN